MGSSLPATCRVLVFVSVLWPLACFFVQGRVSSVTSHSAPSRLSSPRRAIFILRQHVHQFPYRFVWFHHPPLPLSLPRNLHLPAVGAPPFCHLGPPVSRLPGDSLPRPPEPSHASIPSRGPQGSSLA